MGPKLILIRGFIKFFMGVKDLTLCKDGSFMRLNAVHLTGGNIKKGELLQLVS